MTNNNKLLQNNFNQAASAYMENAQIQTVSALKIIDLLPKYHTGDLILDLGSGPGTMQHNKLVNYSSLSFDLSIDMLRVAKSKLKVNGDANSLPFANNTFSTIISNLMIQWATNKSLILNEIYRILKPNGILIFTTLVKPSLFELQIAWQEVDNKSHTLHFLNQGSYLSHLKDSRFHLTQSLSWQSIIYFPTLKELLQHFKKTGTSLAKSSSNDGLGGKRQLENLATAYNRLMTNKGLPLTYAYLLIVAKKEIIR
ncbi:MAG: methyltransferase domain-containing protein [Burkholderiales bacterium]